MASFEWPSGGSGSGVTTYANLAAFPASAADGQLAIALDTHIVYEYDLGTTTWEPIASNAAYIAALSAAISVGPFGSSPNADGLSLVASVLTLQPADATHPGAVSIGVQTLAGDKTFSGTIVAANLSGTNTGDVTLGTANGLSLTGQALSLGLSSTGTTGALSATDWNTFNSKGSVSSVGMTVPTFLSVSGSPVTSSGVLAVSLSGTALPTTSGGTGFVGPFTSTAIPYADVSGNLAQDQSNFNWDATNHRLNLGGHLSTATLGITGSGSAVALDISSTATNTAVNVQNQGAQYAIQFTNSTNSATQGAAFGGAFSRGTTNSKTQVLAGDQVTTWSGQSYNGSSFGPGYNAAIAIIATQNQTSSANGGEIVFATTPNGSLAPVAGLIVGQNQLLQLPAYTTAGILSNDTSGNVTTVTTTGTGSVVLATSPVLVTPNLGTPSTLVGTNITGTAAGLTAGSVTTNANLTGVITSVGNATSIASQTGTGTKFVVDTSPTLVTPNLGTPSALVLTNATGTPTSIGLANGTGLPLSTGVTGQLPIGNGGTGQATKAAGFDALSPMTTLGDLIYGGASGTGTRLAIGSTNNVLTVSGGIPAWGTFSPSAFGTQSAGTYLGGPYSGSAANPTFKAFQAPTVQTFASSSGTYTAPAGVLYIIAELAGPGGGGAGGGTGTSGGAGGNGTANTTFDTLVAAIGGGAQSGQNNGGAGGSPTIGAGWAGVSASAGGAGCPSAGSIGSGGNGGSSTLAGAGAGGVPGLGGGGGASNTGGGGGGGGSNPGNGGPGGGAGAWLRAVKAVSGGTTFSYAVGAGGAAGTAGTTGSAGGAGGSGVIRVTEYYQ